MTGQTVRLRHVFPASCEEVFDAWLDAEGMGAWMCPGPVTSCDATLEARVGGGFRIVMQAPGIEIVNTGEYRALERPTRLQFTWVSSRWANQETLVTVEIRGAGEGECELVLTHEQFPMEHSADLLGKGWGGMLEKMEGWLRRAR